MLETLQECHGYRLPGRYRSFNFGGRGTGCTCRNEESGIVRPDIRSSSSSIDVQSCVYESSLNPYLAAINQMHAGAGCSDPRSVTSSTFCERFRSLGVPGDHRARLDAHAAVTRRCGLLSRFGFDHYRHFHLAPRRVLGTLLLLVQSRRLGACAM